MCPLGIDDRSIYRLTSDCFTTLCQSETPSCFMLLKPEMSSDLLGYFSNKFHSHYIVIKQRPCQTNFIIVGLFIVYVTLFPFITESAAQKRNNNVQKAKKRYNRTSESTSQRKANP